MESFLIQGGGYRNLKVYKLAEIIYDLSVIFTDKYIRVGSRTRDQMEQAARSGKQNIAEGSTASTTSKETEIKLTNVAKASLEELLLDFEDYLRQNRLSQWNKDHQRIHSLRQYLKSEDFGSADFPGGRGRYRSIVLSLQNETRPTAQSNPTRSPDRQLRH